MKIVEKILDELLIYGAGAIGVIVGLFVVTPKNQLAWEPFLMAGIAVAIIGTVAELTLKQVERKESWLQVFRQATAFLLGLAICNAFYY
jgi:hypothetical protein